MLQSGIVGLADLFCFLNRARGTQLVSPDDLLAACKQLGAVGLPFRLRQYADSGVLVVESLEYSEEKTLAALAALLQTRDYLTAGLLARLHEMSVVVAQQQLQAAEARGLLCRDDSVEGLRFYPNKFIPTA
jgi:ESCRT-II complex subunit VPS36